MKKLPNLNTLDPVTRADIQKRKVQHEEVLAKLRSKVKNPSEGYFGPESMTWKLYREPSIILGGIRALLLQIAHPSIAIGVAKYSAFEKDTIGRAHRTFLSMVQIWFGDLNIANNSARRLHIIHSMIRGQLVWETEDEIIINPFCAADPDLLYWVLATIVDTTIQLFEATVRPLSTSEKDQFFEETKITAQLMGIPLKNYPSSLEDFNSRFLTYLENGTLYLGEDGKTITQSIFKVPYPIRRLQQILAEGFMPAQAKPLFNLRPSQTILRGIIRVTRGINWLLPNDLRYASHYHQAMYRLALSNRRSPRWIERCHHWLSTRIDWYFISNKLTPRKKNLCPFGTG
jgi:uncharacterized protein (DUF2236 family)